MMLNSSMSRHMKINLWSGLADFLAKGERNSDLYSTARNSTHRPSHLCPQNTL